MLYTSQYKSLLYLLGSTFSTTLTWIMAFSLRSFELNAYNMYKEFTKFNTDRVWSLSDICMTYFYMSYCPASKLYLPFENWYICIFSLLIQVYAHRKKKETELEKN